MLLITDFLGTEFIEFGKNHLRKTEIAAVEDPEVGSGVPRDVKSKWLHLVFFFSCDLFIPRSRICKRAVKIIFDKHILNFKYCNCFCIKTINL